MSGYSIFLSGLRYRLLALRGGQRARPGKPPLLSSDMALRAWICMRWAVAGAACSLAALAGMDQATLREQAHGGHAARLTTDQVSSRCLALFAGFRNSANLVHEPEFHDEQFSEQLCKVRGAPRHRPVWTVLCDADGTRYSVQFNDLTGNLIGLRPEIGVKAYLALECAAPPIQTPAEAASIAVMWLAQLHLLPPTTRVSLRAEPQLVENGRAWEVVWQAYPSPPASSYEIRLTLARSGGAPVLLVNQNELGQYALEGSEGILRQH